MTKSGMSRSRSSLLVSQHSSVVSNTSSARGLSPSVTMDTLDRMSDAYNTGTYNPACSCFYNRHQLVHMLGLCRLPRLRVKCALLVENQQQAGRSVAKGAKLKRNNIAKSEKESVRYIPHQDCIVSAAKRTSCDSGICDDKQNDKDLPEYLPNHSGQCENTRGGGACDKSESTICDVTKEVSHSTHSGKYKSSRGSTNWSKLKFWKKTAAKKTSVSFPERLASSQLFPSETYTDVPCDRPAPQSDPSPKQSVKKKPMPTLTPEIILEKYAIKRNTLSTISLAGSQSHFAMKNATDHSSTSLKGSQSHDCLSHVSKEVDSPACDIDQSVNVVTSATSKIESNENLSIKSDSGHDQSLDVNSNSSVTDVLNPPCVESVETLYNKCTVACSTTTPVEGDTEPKHVRNVAASGECRQKPTSKNSFGKSISFDEDSSKLETGFYKQKKARSCYDMKAADAVAKSAECESEAAGHKTPIDCLNDAYHGYGSGSVSAGIPVSAQLFLSLERKRNMHKGKLAKNSPCYYGNKPPSMKYALSRPRRRKLYQQKQKLIGGKQGNLSLVLII